MNHLLMRNAYLAFMNIEEDEDLPGRYSLVGEGFKKLSQVKEPTEYTRRFVNESTDTTDIIKYNAEIAYEIDVFSGDPCVQRIVNITDEERRGKKARTDIITLFTEDIVAPPFVCKATKRKYTIIPDRIADDVSVLQATGKMVAMNDKIGGTFDMMTLRFKAGSLYEGRSIHPFNLARFNIGKILIKEY